MLEKVASSKGDNGGAKPPKNAGWLSKRQSRTRKEPVMGEGITFVGLDAQGVDQRRDVAAECSHSPRVAAAERGSAVRRMVHKIQQKAPGEVRASYEAGPCWYALQRQITDSGEAICVVVAPSLIRNSN
jgi:hypothetical protein